MHCPDKQVLGEEHSSFSPHLHCPLVHVSVPPEHLSFSPQVQIFDLHVSDAVEQSSVVVHSGIINVSFMPLYIIFT